MKNNNRITVAFYAPVKNEERYIREFVEFHLNTMKKGDIFVFVDTGSTDNTKEIIKEMIKEKKPILFFDDYPQDHVFSFDFIRNYALSKVPKNIDICLALDIDEFIVKENWRIILEDISKQTNNNFILVNARWEDLSEEKGQNSYFIHQRSAIHSNLPSINWKFPVHECLNNSDPSTKIIDRNDFLTAHMRNQKKERVSYKKIIVDYLKTKPKLSNLDMMHLYYIEGNEYYSDSEYKKALKAYQKYLSYANEFDTQNMTTAFYNNTTAVYIKMSIIYKNMGDIQKELKYKHLAFATKPCRETALMLSLLYITLRLPNLAKDFYNIGISYTNKETSYNTIDWFWEEKNIINLGNSINEIIKNEIIKTEAEKKN